MAQWITPTHDGGRYTASAGSWSVDSGDVTTLKYRLVDTTIIIAFHLDTTSVSTTPASLRITLPEGRSAATTMQMPVLLIDNGTAAWGIATVTALASTIVITRLDGANFAAATNATGVYGQIMVEFHT